MRHRLPSLVLGLILVSTLVTVDPGAIALLNVEFLVVAGSVAMAMTRENLRMLRHRVLASNPVIYARVGWRMTRENPRAVIAA